MLFIQFKLHFIFNFHFISKYFLFLTWQDLSRPSRASCWERAKTPQQPPKDAVWGSCKKRKEAKKRSRTRIAEAAWCRAGPEGSGQTARRWKTRGWKTDEDKGEPPAEKRQRRSGEKTSASRGGDKEGAASEDGGGWANAEVAGGSRRGTRYQWRKARNRQRWYKRRWWEGEKKRKEPLDDEDSEDLSACITFLSFAFTLHCFPILRRMIFVTFLTLHCCRKHQDLQLPREGNPISGQCQLWYVSSYLFPSALRKKLRTLGMNLQTASVCLKAASKIAQSLEDEYDWWAVSRILLVIYCTFLGRLLHFIKVGSNFDLLKSKFHQTLIFQNQSFIKVWWNFDFWMAEFYQTLIFKIKVSSKFDCQNLTFIKLW